MARIIIATTCLALAVCAGPSVLSAQTVEQVSQQGYAACQRAYYPNDYADYAACWQDVQIQQTQAYARQNGSTDPLPQLAPFPAPPQTDDAGTAVLNGIAAAAQARADADAAASQALQQRQQPTTQHTICTRVAATPVTPSGLNCITTNY